jgi:hypothetical protein
VRDKVPSSYPGVRAAQLNRYALVMNPLLSTVIVLILTSCATADNGSMPSSWITTESSIEGIHEYNYEFCLNIKAKQKNQDCEKGAGNPFKHELEPGYKVYRYKTSPESWKEFSGSAGFVLVIKSKVVDEITTAIQ